MLDGRICCDDSRNGADVHLPHFSNKGSTDMGLGRCHAFVGLPLAGIANKRKTPGQGYVLSSGRISTYWFGNSQFRAPPSDEENPASNPL